MKLGVTDFIDCAHFLPDHPKCGRLHGHTYKVEMVIVGENETGMVVDFAELKKMLRGALSRYDHKALNDFLDYPSVENICAAIHQELTGRVPFPFTIRVWEGHGKWAEM
jgi:6-pyruvoyltetrahydropterin/6-carboxytetrahydropterin synthase